MGHTPYGYRIENGIAVIDEDAAGKLRKLYENYLSGLSLKDAAAEAGIDTYHGTAKRLLKTQHYIGDEFYPAIIDETIFQPQISLICHILCLAAFLILLAASAGARIVIAYFL